MVPIALMAAGTALQIVGNLRANYAQADAEMKNSEFYAQEAEYARDSMFRQAQIASYQYEARKGSQISAIYKGGADMSGSAAAIVADTVAQKAQELQAIKQKGELDYKLAILRSRNAATIADQLRDPTNNFLQSATILTKNLTANAEPGNDIFKFLGGIERNRSTSGDISGSPNGANAPVFDSAFSNNNYLGDHTF